MMKKNLLSILSIAVLAMILVAVAFVPGQKTKAQATTNVNGNSIGVDRHLNNQSQNEELLKQAQLEERLDGSLKNSFYGKLDFKKAMLRGEEVSVNNAEFTEERSEKALGLFDLDFNMVSIDGEIGLQTKADYCETQLSRANVDDKYG